MSLRDLAGELSTTEYRERRKIATYLHDSVGQAIAVLSLKLGMLKVSPDKADLQDEIDDLLAQVADDMRLTTYELSPPTLYEFGLGSAVQHLAADLSKRHTVDIAVHDQLQNQPFHDDILPLLYRFVRELLMNVIKHASATHAAVRLRPQGRSVLIEVEDNGIGIDFSSIGEGFGLYSIRERAQAMQIGFDIRRSAGGGTLAVINVPVRPED